jgi:hypothetical protein
LICGEAYKTGVKYSRLGLATDLCREAQPDSYFMQAFIMGPKVCGTQARRSEKLCVNIANPKTKEGVSFDEAQDLTIACHYRWRQILQGLQYRIPLTQISQGKLTDHERMNEHLPRSEQCLQPSIAFPQMVNPYGRINQNHSGLGLRRGATDSFG